jgi:CheY-like chemotaxis protein
MFENTKSWQLESTVAPEELLELDLATYTRRCPILINDDDAATVRLYQTILARQSLTSIATTQPHEAIAAARRQNCALLITDLQKPGMTGLDFMALLRDDPAIAPMPVVMITSTASPAMAEAFYAAGGSQLLTKPVNIQRFCQIITDLLTQQVTPEAA